MLSVKQFSKKPVLLASFTVFIVLVIFLWKPQAPVSKALMSPAFVNQSQKIVRKYANNPQGIPLLLLFTTFSPSLSKNHIYTNTLHNWALLHPAVQPLMFYDKKFPSYLKETMKKLGWALLPIPKYNSYNLPIMCHMFETAIDNFPALHYGFSNGDILFDDSLVLTLEALYQHPMVEDFLLVGRRINYKFKAGELVHSLAEVRQLTKQDSAKMFIKEAEDYFITTKNALPWDDLPNFVIGRVGFDNWLVSYAMRNGPLVIDGTNTVLCLHQSGEDGNYAGFDAVAVPKYNIDLFGKFDYSLGSTDCPYWITVFNEKLKSVIIRRRPPHFCYGHQRKYFEHQDVGISEQ